MTMMTVCADAVAGSEKTTATAKDPNLDPNPHSNLGPNLGHHPHR